MCSAFQCLVRPFLFNPDMGALCLFLNALNYIINAILRVNTFNVALYLFCNKEVVCFPRLLLSVKMSTFLPCDIIFIMNIPKKFIIRYELLIDCISHNKCNSAEICQCINFFTIIFKPQNWVTCIRY